MTVQKTEKARSCSDFSGSGLRRRGGSSAQSCRRMLAPPGHGDDRCSCCTSETGKSCGRWPTEHSPKKFEDVRE